MTADRDDVGTLVATALAHAPVSIVVTTADGRIVYVNPEFERVTGYASAEAIGRTPALLKSGQQRPEIYERMWAALRAGHPWRGELVNRRKSGELYAAALSISPVLDEQGCVVHFVGSHRDVTQDRALRAVLEDRARELAVVREEQDEFVANVGVALSEPLRELAQVAAGATDAAGSSVAALVKRLAGRVDELMHLQRVGRDHALFTRVDLEELMTEVASDLSGAIAERQGRLELQPLPAVFGSRPMMRELLRMLVAHALHHGGPSPHVRIREVRPCATPGYVELAVSCDGPSIPESERERMFLPFYRAHQDGSDGAVLALCRKAAERHGGRLWAAAPPRGIELRTTLPSARGRLALERAVNAARFQAPESTGEVDGPLRVLVVENDPLTAERVVAGLRPDAESVRVETASTAAEALQRAGAEDLDAALISTDLPDAGGLELLERLRRQTPGLPVLVVTGVGDERLAVLAMKMGAADYVTHEEIPAVLRRAVLSAVSSARAARALDAARGDLIGIVTHDLKNPLANILGYTDLVLEFATALPPAVVRHLQRVRENSSFMFELIADILDTERIDCGKLKLVASREDMRALVHTAVERSAFLAADKGSRITTALPDAPLWAPVDSRKIAQVLSNLLSNALKFSPPNADVEIGARAVPDAVEVWVRDAGPGIAPAERELLFKKFSRTSVRATKGEKSTGLGLFIVQEILKLHGGEVRVESQPGQGSTFSFRLPAAL